MTAPERRRPRRRVAVVRQQRKTSVAYLNFSETMPAMGSSQERVPDGFSALEWLVIGVARKDPLSSLDTPGRLARAMRSLFGLGARSRLAEGRLERLRRMAVLAWHRGWRLPESEVAAFLRDYSGSQLETLLAAIGRQKPTRFRKLPA